KQLFKDTDNPDFRLRAMWALHLTGGFSQKELLESLSDKDQHVRAWAIQLLCEDLDPSEEALKKFTLMAKEDPSPVVRLYLAAALQRIGDEQKWDLASNLLQHVSDSADHNLPKMTWYGIEPLMAKNPEKFLELATQSQI